MLLKVVFLLPSYNNIISCCSPFHNFSLENFGLVLFISDSNHYCSNSFLSLGPPEITTLLSYLPQVMIPAIMVPSIIFHYISLVSKFFDLNWKIDAVSQLCFRFLSLRYRFKFFHRPELYFLFLYQNLLELQIPSN